MVLPNCENATRAVRSKRGMSSCERRLIANFVNGTDRIRRCCQLSVEYTASQLDTHIGNAVYYGEQITTIAKESFQY